MKKTKLELETKYDGVVKNFKEDIEKLNKELDETKKALGDLEDESIKLFGEGYREYWGRGAARGMDMEPDKFEVYLGELKERIKNGVSATENPQVMETCED